MFINTTKHDGWKKNKENRGRYSEIQRNIRKAVRIAKERWTEKQCKETEALERKQNHFNMHRKIKEDESLEKRKNYIQNLFEDEQGDNAKKITGVSRPI